MTDISYTSTSSTRSGLWERIVAIPRALAVFFDTIHAGMEAARRYEELNSLTDVELEQRGLTRDQIVRQIHDECF
ncbi:MAG: hypothetical protein ACK5JR_10940 [Tropicimonas sp.]|uniref:hypothetical protein n=1 Tax=Tropicimonas sp. TaxID=2067044 RepID=UPI003A88C604